MSSLTIRLQPANVRSLAKAMGEHSGSDFARVIRDWLDTEYGIEWHALVFEIQFWGDQVRLIVQKGDRE